jgi:transposase-like protein
VTAGTIFQDTRKPLTLWFRALEEGVRGRQTDAKALIVVAAQEDGPGIGRIRMRQILDASAESLMPFVRDPVEPGSIIHTDGWLGYEPVKRNGYRQDVTFLRGKKKTPSELMPRIHRVISFLKRWWLMGTQGAVSLEHLDYYLDEFTFRFNRGSPRAGANFFSTPPAGCRGRSGPLTSRWSNATRLHTSPDHNI